MRHVLVGELNPYGTSPEMALYPLPRHASGNRLREILGLSDLDYLAKFDRVNLCTGKWSLAAARESAELLARDPAARGRVLVLLGSKVCRAFGVPFEPFTVKPYNSSLSVAVLPHPSGLNRLWNDPQNKRRARELLSKLPA